MEACNPLAQDPPTGEGCPHCLAGETNPYWGGFQQHPEPCRGCAVRFTSLRPRDQRDLIFSAITDPATRDQFRADCVAEYRRREVLKAERPLQ
jgi:hypothetical protein